MNPIKKALIHKYRDAASQLDLVRTTALKELPQQGDAHTSTNSPDRISHPYSINTMVGLIWRNLFQPCRGIWSTLAVVWLVIIGLRLSDHVASENTVTTNTQGMVTWAAAWNELHLHLAELTDEAPEVKPPDAHKEKMNLPAPRSQLNLKQSA